MKYRHEGIEGGISMPIIDNSKSWTISNTQHEQNIYSLQWEPRIEQISLPINLLIFLMVRNTPLDQVNCQETVSKQIKLQL